MSHASLTENKTEADYINISKSDHQKHEHSLACEGIFKVASLKENFRFNYCNSEYWNCPNKKCIMQLV